MKPEVWDSLEQSYLANWDGTQPEVTADGRVIVNELDCNCEPPGCGGCVEVKVELYVGERYKLHPGIIT